LRQVHTPEIIFKHASVSSLDLSGSLAAMGIDAAGMRAGHDIVLAAGFVANRRVTLNHATLDGVLRCDGGSFVNEGGDALSADGISVRGDIFLRLAFRAKGMVRFLGAQIGGNLECNAASFVNATGAALSADGIYVKGNVFLGPSFSAGGGVRLPGANVDGDLTCTGSFENTTGNALNADRIDVKGDISLGSGFRAKGEVRFCGANVGGDLDCSAGRFEKGEVEDAIGALSADGISVSGDVFLGSGLRAKGEARLPGARVGGDLDCDGGIFRNEAGVALKANGIHVAGSLFVGKDFLASGVVDIRHAHVGVLVDLESSWPAKLRLDGFTYDAIDGPTGAGTRLEWLKRWPDEGFRPQPYEQLASVLRRMGHERDAREISFAKQVALRKSGQLGRAGWLWSWLLWATIGYGYRFWLALIWATGLLMVGFLVTVHAHGRGNLRPDPNAPANVQMAEGSGEWDELLHAISYSLNATFPLPIADLSGVPWQLREKGSNDWHYWSFAAWFLFQRLFGWLLAGLMIAAASGLIKKE
jgi:hypothetical protein